LAHGLNDDQKTENKGHKAYDTQRLDSSRIYLLYDSLSNKTPSYLTFFEEDIDEAGEKTHNVT
jgi:hypothetical protein